MNIVITTRSLQHLIRSDRCVRMQLLLLFQLHPIMELQEPGLLLLSVLQLLEPLPIHLLRLQVSVRTTATMTIVITTRSLQHLLRSVRCVRIATAPALPTTSNNGITGTWSPATINTATVGTTTYTFTPAAGQCGTTTTMSIVITTRSLQHLIRSDHCVRMQLLLLFQLHPTMESQEPGVRLLSIQLLSEQLPIHLLRLLVSVVQQPP